MSKKNFVRLSEMPYYNTKVSVAKSQEDIQRLFKKYNIDGEQWTRVGDKHSLRFFFSFTRDGNKYKATWEIILPVMHAYYLNKLIDVPDEMKFRMLFYNLKGLLEATRWGLVKMEDIFMAGILLRLPDGTVRQAKDYIWQNQDLLALPEG